MHFYALLTNVIEFTHEISITCYSSKLDNAERTELLRAKAILLSLNNHANLLTLLSKMHQSDFADSVKVHSARYLKQYAKHEGLKDDALLFEKYTQEFLENLNDTTRHCGEQQALMQSQETRNDEKNLEPLKEKFFRIIQKVQLFFSNQIQNKDALEYLHATSIVFRIGLKDNNNSSWNEDFAKPDRLIDLFLLTKELWNIDYVKTSKQGDSSISEKFYKNPTSYIKIADHFDTKTVFRNILDLLTNSDHSVLTHLSDEQILSLYDRLKNHTESEDIIDLLVKLHAEAQFRYSYSRLSDVGYQLLSRLQSFDAISHNIENLEFSVLEAYLFKRSHFAKEMLVNLAKHADNIKALSLNKNENLKKILDYIDRSLQINSSDNNVDNNMLISLRENLNKMVHSHVKKRYVDLDKFTIHILQNKYKNLFLNIELLFSKKEEAKLFLHNTLTARLASDYYLPNLSNSIEKLRIMAQERKKAFNILYNIDFLALFGPNNFNKIKSFSFRKKFDDTDLKTAVEYVTSVINDIALHTSAFQLETLYKFGMDSDFQEQNKEIANIIISAVKTQIKQRATIRNLVYSIISGRKKEYDKLKSLKKIASKEEEGA